ncbi:MAG: hypothetical protein J5663_04925, partial [Bacteroidaceae bacterium]|nr:hypothetical protein [Bacteroidaceae bacterium]
MMKHLLKKFVLLLLMLVSVTLSVNADDLEKYWENIPSELRERYNLANRKIGEDWVLQFADSLDTKSRELNNLRLRMFASQIRSHYAFAKNDSASYIYHNDNTMSLAKEANAMHYYYTEKMGRIMFYYKNHHRHLALTTVQELLNEAKENNDIHGIYFGYMSMCYFYSTKRSPQQAIEYGIKATECLDMMDNPNDFSKTYIYNQLAINYLNLRDYENCIKNIKVALQYNDALPDMYFTLCKAYFEMGDIHNFKETAGKYMEKKEQNGFMFFTDDNVIKALTSIIDKDYKSAQTYIDSIGANEDKMYCLLRFYKAQNNWQKAYECQEMISNYEDSIALTMYSEEISDMSGELDSLYRVKEKDEILMRQRFYMIITGIIIFAIIIMSIIVILRYRTVKHKNQALAHNIDKLIKYKQKVLELENEKYGKRPAPSLNDELEEMDDDINDENEEEEEEEE